jgi:hypothetical protein
MQRHGCRKLEYITGRNSACRNSGGHRSRGSSVGLEAEVRWPSSGMNFYPARLIGPMAYHYYLVVVHIGIAKQY